MRNYLWPILLICVFLSGFLGFVSAFLVYRDTDRFAVEHFVRIPQEEKEMREPEEVLETAESVVKTVEFFAEDAHQQRMLEELQSVHEWADGHRIFISETGIPHNDNSERYRALMSLFFETVDTLSFDVTTWSTGPLWGDYPIVPHDPTTLEDNSISAPFNASRTTDLYFRGVNLAGAEFGLKPDADGEIGIVGGDYTYFAGDPIWQSIRDKGYTHVRFPFRLERLFDSSTGAFREDDRVAFIEALDSARAAGIKVIVDPHNYGALQVNGQKQILGDEVFTVSLYNEMMAQVVSLVEPYDDTVVMIGLMNEPKNLLARDWEIYAQSAVDHLRDIGWTGLIEVPTGEWQGAKDVADLHRRPWISDPAENFVYGVHQYFDYESTGFYADSYGSDEEKIGIKYKPRGVKFRVRAN